ncbi:MAG: hypothetical protein ACOVO3_03300 [Fluviicola sp.]|jgi:hypothetical protein
MKNWIVRLLICLPLLHACVLEEAPVDQSRKLTIYSDSLTAQDSIFLNNYAKKHHVELQFRVLSANAIKETVLKEKFSCQADLILVSDEVILTELRLAGYLQRIAINRFFESLERQFSNNHHQVLPVCHNPLIVLNQKDSSSICKRLNFQTWHQKDSLYPKFHLVNLKPNYLSKIESSPFLNSLYNPKQWRMQSSELVTPLSLYIDRKDSLERLSFGCAEPLIIKKRTISLVTGIALLKYSSNKQEAHRFLNAFQDYRYIFSSERNQLPTAKNVPASPKIKQSLN